MATYIALIDYTDQGIRGIKDSPERAIHFAEQARRHAVDVKDLFWTSGKHDGVLIMEAPDDKAVSALMLSLGRGGNVRTHTMRAYDRDEMEQILGNTD